MTATTVSLPAVTHLTMTGFHAGQVLCGAARTAGGSYVHAGYQDRLPGGSAVCGDCVHVWDCETDGCPQCAAMGWE